MLKFHPRPGTILICDYTTGFRKPEMVKRRPVVVVSPRLRRRNGLCAVVPLSTTPPNSAEAYHCRIVFERSLPEPWSSPEMWAKCDMLATVGFGRLDLIRTARDPATGTRKYLTVQLKSEDLESVKRAVLASLGM